MKTIRAPRGWTSPNGTRAATYAFTCVVVCCQGQRHLFLGVLQVVRAEEYANLDDRERARRAAREANSGRTPSDWVGCLSRGMRHCGSVVPYGTWSIQVWTVPLDDLFDNAPNR
jgi:hypothetical protein